MDTQPFHCRLGFRSDIEGMRAVAIMLVVAAHAGVAGLAGGFIGVDVFFVLSGYLITGLLVQEIRSTGTLRLAAFFARRLRRLLPGLLLMLAGTCVLAWLLIAPAEQPGQASGAGTAAMWISNFHFAFAKLGYFTPAAETNLFLHTWSLGVEEQFYLVWPLLLMLALGCGRKKAFAFNPRRLQWTLLAIFALSLAGCAYWTHVRPHLAFYMMPARSWQFALGALVFLRFGAPATGGPTKPATLGSAVNRWQHALTRWGGWLGLTLIALSALWLTPDMPYPGLRALAPSLGAALLLAAGARSPRTGAGRCLSLRPMQAIGRVSYAWYLWHWPILLLGATLVRADSTAYRMALVVLSLLLAAGSYHVLETPMRRNRHLIARPRIAVLASLALMLIGASLALRWNTAAVLRMTQPEQARYVAARSDAPRIYRVPCDEWGTRVKVCSFGSPKAAHTAVAIGDSIALQWFPAFAELFDKVGWRLLVITKSSCPMVDAPVFYARIGREYTECAIWRKTALQTVAFLKPDVVILGSADSYGYTQRQWQAGTAKVLRTLSPAAGRIYVIRSTPSLGFDGPACLAPRSRLYGALSNRSACTAPAESRRNEQVFAWLQTAVRPFANVAMLDMNSAVCPGGVCRAEHNGQIHFRDARHLSATFARSLGVTMGQRLDAIARRPAAAIIITP